MENGEQSCITGAVIFITTYSRGYAWVMEMQMASASPAGLSPKYYCGARAAGFGNGEWRRISRTCCQHREPEPMFTCQ
tara:strand:+ start:44 stop:277 length:234 start_codon:yes stop_codon:yes gene_type:complete